MKTVRAGTFALVAFAVLSFGGVQSWGQGILEIGAAVLFVMWGFLAAREDNLKLQWNWLYVPVVGLLAIALAQYAFQISVYPYLTKLELLRWCAYAVLFFLTCQLVRSESQVKQFVWFAMILGFVVSLFGIVQHFASNGKIYWLVPVPDGANPFGPYVNADHFAGFVELTVPFGLALLLFPSRHRDKIPLLLLLTIVPIGAVLLSASRGGILGLIVELFLLVFLSRSHRAERKRLLGAGALALMAGVFVVWLGVGHAIERFEQLGHGISTQLRLSIYSDSAHIFVNHPWVGTGLGTLVVAYPGYASFYDGRTVDHAHNDYLELLADTGVIGGLLGGCFVGLFFWRAIENFESTKRSFTRASMAGALVAGSGLLFHSLVDFNLHIPSNALLFLLACSVATSENRDVGGAARVYRNPDLKAVR
jgi:O-antigen ligase